VSFPFLEEEVFFPSLLGTVPFSRYSSPFFPSRRLVFFSFFFFWFFFYPLFFKSSVLLLGHPVRHRLERAPPFFFLQQKQLVAVCPQVLSRKYHFFFPSQIRFFFFSSVPFPLEGFFGRPLLKNRTIAPPLTPSKGASWLAEVPPFKGSLLLSQFFFPGSSRILPSLF